jgi:hypothetical protein
MSKSRNICTDPKCANYQRYCRIHIGFTVPSTPEINKVSDKKKQLDKEYKKVRKQYLSAHPLCEAKIEGVCSKVAVEIHHRAGKATEEDYLNSDLFLAVCRKCHSTLEVNPAFARQKGFSISRLSKRA